MTVPAAGIDTASWQGAPDWAKVAAAGISFVYIKASEGGSTSYPTLDKQYAGARAAGLTVGLYHYAKTGQSATSNADALAAQVNRLGAKAGHLPPCLDIEEGAGNLASWADTFIERLRQRTGVRRVMLYSGTSFFKDRLGEGWMDDDIALWIAHYGKLPGQPGYKTPRVAIHQYSQIGKVAGIAGAVDLNVALKPLSELTMAANPKGTDDVALSDTDIRRIADTILDTPVPRQGAIPNAGKPLTLRGMVAWFDAVATHAPFDDARAQELLVAVQAIRTRLDAQ